MDKFLKELEKLQEQKFECILNMCDECIKGIRAGVTKEYYLDRLADAAKKLNALIEEG